MLTPSLIYSTPEPSINYSRQIISAFVVKIPVVTAPVMLAPEEATLSVIKWRLQNMNLLSPWYPVLQKYLGLVEGRVTGLGGDPSSIPPSLTGVPSTPSGCNCGKEHHCHPKHHHPSCTCGKPKKHNGKSLFRGNVSNLLLFSKVLKNMRPNHRNVSKLVKHSRDQVFVNARSHECHF